jgi:hypothetical protein
MVSKRQERNVTVVKRMNVLSMILVANLENAS